jgi:hypothetical protein
LSRSASQRIIIALVPAIDFLAVEALISDLHPCPKCADCRIIFHYETNGLSSSGKTPIAEPLPRTTLTLGGEQFGR